jgi:hypothetical protein
VIDVFDSEDDAKRFVQERVLPAIEAVGAELPPPPQFWHVYNCLT